MSISLFNDCMVIAKVPWSRPASALPLSLKTTLDWHIASNTSYFRYFGATTCLRNVFSDGSVVLKVFNPDLFAKECSCTRSPYQGSQSLPYPNVLQTLAGRCVSPGASHCQV